MITKQQDMPDWLQSNMESAFFNRPNPFVLTTEAGAKLLRREGVDVPEFPEFEAFQEKLKAFVNEQATLVATNKEKLFCDALRNHLMREPTMEDAARCTLAKHPQRGSFDVVETLFYDEIRLGVLITKTNGVFFIPEKK